MTAPTDNEPGRIITFYSYKGGTGRSMALANVAWILASNGWRVLTVDWDLEAPGLHRYFAPFLLDPEVVESDGVIDIVTNYVTAVMTPHTAPAPSEQPTEATAAAQGDSEAQPGEAAGASALEGAIDEPHTSAAPEASKDDGQWYASYANVLRYASSLTWRFAPYQDRQGWIDFIPAGRQGTSYASRMNAFSWQNFYDRLGGGGFIDALKKSMRAEYDYVLIDSRTGVSDTSGVCTVQLPDALAVCFTLNRQSVEGAGAVAASVDAQRRVASSSNGLRIFPIPTRVEKAEKDKLDLAREAARDQFADLLTHVAVDVRDQYWGDVEIHYEPFYAYEEVLATLGDKPGQPASMLAAMERVTGWLTDRPTQLVPVDETERQRALAKYARQSRKARAATAASVGADTEFVFYVSYARSDLDESLERFFDHLMREVRLLTGGASSTRVGFVDLDIAAGTDWQQQLERALQRSRVLVPIYSPAYFASDGTGREFQYFLKRSAAAPASPTGVLPVIWVMPGDALPRAAASITYTSSRFPDAYTNVGLRTLMRLRRYEDEYNAFVSEFARQLVEMSRSTPMTKDVAARLSELDNAFASGAPAPPDPVAEASPADELLQYAQSWSRRLLFMGPDDVEEHLRIDIIPEILAATAEARVQAAEELLHPLKKRRLFDTLASTAAQFIQAGAVSPGIQLLYAEALVAQNNMTGALAALRPLPGSGSLEDQIAVLTLTGDACARLWLDSHAPRLPRNQQHLVRAIRSYSRAYELDSSLIWQAARAVALTLRAIRDAVPLPLSVLDRTGEMGSDPGAAAQTLAMAILSRVQERLDAGEAALWDYAAASSASLALQSADISQWVASVVQEPDVDGRDLATVLWHLAELWQLDERSPLGRQTLPLLRATLLHARDAVLIMSPDVVRLDQDLPDFEQLVGGEVAAKIRSYRSAMYLLKDVARISAPELSTPRTGFATYGTDVLAELGPHDYLITTGLADLPDVSVLARSVEETWRIRKVVVSKPTSLDLTVAGIWIGRPRSETRIARRPPDRGNRLYVVGYTTGADPRLVLASAVVSYVDETRVWYRCDAPVTPGSAVFTDAWDLVGMHRAFVYRRDVDVHHAGEALLMTAIADAIVAAKAPPGAEVGGDSEGNAMK